MKQEKVEIILVLLLTSHKIINRNKNYSIMEIAKENQTFRNWPPWLVNRGAGPKPEKNVHEKNYDRGNGHG